MAADRRLARPGSPQEAAYGHGAACVLVGRGSRPHRGTSRACLPGLRLRRSVSRDRRRFRLRARGALGPGRGSTWRSCRTQSGWRSSALQSRRRASRISSLPPRRASRSRSLGPRPAGGERRRGPVRRLRRYGGASIRCCCLRMCLERDVAWRAHLVGPALARVPTLILLRATEGVRSARRGAAEAAFANRSRRSRLPALPVALRRRRNGLGQARRARRTHRADRGLASPPRRHGLRGRPLPALRHGSSTRARAPA
jgi:hypothetical protein